MKPKTPTQEQSSDHSSEWLDKTFKELYYLADNETQGRMITITKQAVQAELSKAFRNGQLDCQKAGRIDNHAAYPSETLKAKHAEALAILFLLDDKKSKVIVAERIKDLESELLKMEGK